MKRLEYYWYTRNPWLLLLTPVSLVYHLAVLLRRYAYRTGLRRSQRISVPVIVVGNLTVGGTGKTPLVAWLAGFLRAAGYRPGIIARGYKGKASNWPQQVRPDSDPKMVGDEAVMLAGKGRCPMAVGPDRVAAAKALVKHSDCNLILSDDGLQHYALGRDVEIVVIDGIRRFGNGLFLPAGPLREPRKRINEADLVVVNGLGPGSEHQMKMHLEEMCKLSSPDECIRIAAMRRQPVHAIAGIGNPDRFFLALRQAGLTVEEHAFPDHYAYREQDLDFGDDRPVLMTEKDAVKCRAFARNNFWYVPVTVEMPANFGHCLLELLEKRRLSAQETQPITGV